MGNAGSPYGHFRTALRTGSYGLARNVALGLPHIGLSDALALTMLAAEKDPEGFEPMARRWLERFLQERRPTLLLVKWVAGDLESIGAKDCPPFIRTQAEARLREVAGRL